MQATNLIVIRKTDDVTGLSFWSVLQQIDDKPTAKAIEKSLIEAGVKVKRVYLSYPTADAIYGVCAAFNCTDND